MFECLIIGDSIGVGLSTVRPECHAVVRNGIGSKRWLETFIYNPIWREHLFKVAVISLGTNDMVYTKTEEELYNIRLGTRANLVIWILPNEILKPTQADIIRKLAKEFNDKVLDIRPWVGADQIHPPAITEYKKVSDVIKELSGSK